jgi:hypothetical protein
LLQSGAIIATNEKGNNYILGRAEIMQLITLYNKIFVEYLLLMQSCLISGRQIPDKLTEAAKECGKLAEVPEDRLAIIDLIESKVKTIH